MDDCIEWKGYRGRNGYGYKGKRVNGKHKLFSVHRRAYEQVHGPIPKGLCVMHICDNPPCYNVNHLKLGTHLENNRDMKQKGRGNWAKGEASGKSKLTESQVREIKALLLTDMSIVDISKLYRVTNMAIHSIKSNRTWQHVRA